MQKGMNMQKHTDIRKQGWILKVFIFTVLASMLYSCNKKAEEDIPTTSVVQGTFYMDVYESGEIEAINSVNVSSPNISWRYGNLKITQIVKDGSEVKVGDTLVVFDPSEVKKAVVEAESNLDITKAEMDKMKAQHQSDIEELNASLKVTRLSRDISKIRFESSGYEASVKKKEIELNFEKADIALKRAEEQLQNRKKIQIEEIKQNQLSINQNKARLDEAHETLQKLYLTTPTPGIAIINRNWSTNNKFQVGDQCWSGFPLIQLPDLTSLKATVKINEVDISKISKDMRVEIKADAFSDKAFPGKVTAVANLAVNKDENSQIKVFPVEIRILKTDKNLLPGLTVSCRIIVDQIDNILSLPIEAVYAEGDKNYVFKKIGKKFEKTEIETGRSNSDHIIIAKGLSKGDLVSLVNIEKLNQEKEQKSAGKVENEEEKAP